MREQAILLNVSGQSRSVYETRGLITFSSPPGADGWAPAPAVTSTLVQTVRPSQRYAAPRHTANANAPAAMSATEKERAIDWYKRARDIERESGRRGQKTPQFGEVSGV